MKDPFSMDQVGWDAAYKWLNETHQFHLLDEVPKADGYTVITLANTLWAKEHIGHEREFDIWMEGYITNGNRSDAQFVERAKGWTFYDAVHNLSKRMPGKFNWRGGEWDIWLCTLYDNEVDARHAFG